MASRVEALARLDTEDARTFRHVPGLDGLRAIAVLLVIAFHYGAHWSKNRDGGLLPGGFLGVDIFFVLSGFLITSLLVGEKAKVGRVSLPKFYARRGLRLFPALVLVLVAHAVYWQWIGGSMKAEVKQVLAVVFYVSNFAEAYWMPEMAKSGLAFTWSLAIEEQFYLLWPALLVFGVLRYCKTRTSVLVVIGGAALASALIRVVVWKWGGDYAAAYTRPDCRADGLLIGAFCAFAWRWGLVPRRYLNQAAMVCAAALGVTALTATLNREADYMFNYGFFLVSLATGVILLAIAENRTNLLPILEWSPLRLIGRVSYGLYLWHVLCLRIASRAFPDVGRVNKALIGLVIMTTAVTLSWHFVEQPFLRLKSRVASPVSH